MVDVITRKHIKATIIYKKINIQMVSHVKNYSNVKPYQMVKSNTFKYLYYLFHFSQQNFSLFSLLCYNALNLQYTSYTGILSKDLQYQPKSYYTGILSKDLQYQPKSYYTGILSKDLQYQPKSYYTGILSKDLQYQPKSYYTGILSKDIYLSLSTHLSISLDPNRHSDLHIYLCMCNIWQKINERNLFSRK